MKCVNQINMGQTRPQQSSIPPAIFQIVSCRQFFFFLYSVERLCSVINNKLDLIQLLSVRFIVHRPIFICGITYYTRVYTTVYAVVSGCTVLPAPVGVGNSAAGVWVRFQVALLLGIPSLSLGVKCRVLHYLDHCFYLIMTSPADS